MKQILKLYPSVVFVAISVKCLVKEFDTGSFIAMGICAGLIALFELTKKVNPNEDMVAKQVALEDSIASLKKDLDSVKSVNNALRLGRK
jgi:cell division protein ZapA (FtsZ GTPase activity inhibitor)